MYEANKTKISIVRSPLLRTLETLVFSPFLVAGAAIERQWLSIIFFQEFLNDPTSLATQINIQLQSQFIQVGLHKKGRVRKYILY